MDESRAIRKTLDQAGLDRTLIMSYSAKFHSKFYGPFRVAADSAPKGDGIESNGSCDLSNRPGELRRRSRKFFTRRPRRRGYFDGETRDALSGRAREAFGRKFKKPWAVYEVSGEFAAIELMARKGLDQWTCGASGSVDCFRARRRFDDHHLRRAFCAGLVEAEWQGKKSVSTTKSEALFERAKKVSPGGVHSPVRGFRGVGGMPRFIDRARRREMFDVDGNRYVDFCMAWGPLLFGHRDPKFGAR